MAMVKKRVSAFPPESPEEQFAKMLTPFALDFVIKQLNFRKKMTIVEHNDANSVVSSSAGI